MEKSQGDVVAVARDDTHRFSKALVPSIRITEGLGVDGDAHRGVHVQHRSRIARGPDQPNLRQVHLLHQELLDDLHGAGFPIEPGALGENITTRGVDLLGLPRDTRLHVGSTAVLQVTGLRNPCAQIEQFQPGLLAQVLGHADDGTLIRKTGIMTVAVASGDVRVTDRIEAELPPKPWHKLEVV